MGQESDVHERARETIKKVVAGQPVTVAEATNLQGCLQFGMLYPDEVNQVDYPSGVITKAINDHLKKVNVTITVPKPKEKAA